MGLCSTEVGIAPSLFKDVFEQAAKLGLHRVAHAGGWALLGCAVLLCHVLSVVLARRAAPLRLLPWLLHPLHALSQPFQTSAAIVRALPQTHCHACPPRLLQRRRGGGA